MARRSSIFSQVYQFPTKNLDKVVSVIDETAIRNEVDIAEVILKFNLDYDATEDDSKALDLKLEFTSAVELYNTIVAVHQQTALKMLENHVIWEYLKKNDPKMLIGLQAKRPSLTKPSGSHTLHISAPSDHSFSKPSLSGVSVALSMGFTERKKLKDFVSNSKHKSHMAEKAYIEIEKNVADIEKKAFIELKQLQAQIEEMQYRKKENETATHSFHEQFLEDESDITYLDHATEAQLRRKLYQFMQTWHKSARTNLGVMRLTIGLLEDTCNKNRADMAMKGDLSAILTVVDFEKLLIERAELQTTLDDIMVNLAGLKSVGGTALQKLSEIKKGLIKTENEIKFVDQKTKECKRAIRSLEKETQSIHKENENDQVELTQLRQKINEFEAPSIAQYIDLKEDLISLEKEEKMLGRKIAIATMTIKNLQNRAKKRR